MHIPAAVFLCKMKTNDKFLYRKSSTGKQQISCTA